MKKTYKGSCHCGTVRFEADIDLTQGTFKCNCEICTKTRMWGAIVAPKDFRLLSGETDLVEYHPGYNHHPFCQKCGGRGFGWGVSEKMGGKFYAIRVAALDNLDVDELMKGPVKYFDGLHDNFQSAPAEIRHL